MYESCILLLLYTGRFDIFKMSDYCALVNITDYAIKGTNYEKENRRCYNISQL